MNYEEFKSYRNQLEAGLMRFDDLNPFEIRQSTHYIGNFRDFILRHFHNDSIQITNGSGVRDLLDKLFASLPYRKALIPSDTYPVYQKIASKYFEEIIEFPTIPKLKIPTNHNNCVLLISNPLIPSGLALSDEIIKTLSDWLKNDSVTILIDCCYNFEVNTILPQLSSKRAYELYSASKLYLKNKSEGIALRWEFTSENASKKDLSKIMDLPVKLNEKMARCWQDFEPKLLEIDSNWTRPSQGYLSIIDCPYSTLKDQFGIAAIPATVFGSNLEKWSVLSVLSFLKHEVIY